MSITVHQRPGVYSDYDVSSLIYGSGKGKTVGMVGLNTVAEAGKAYTVTGYEQAVNLFTLTGNLATMAGLALRNGARSVVCVPVADASGYQAAFELLGAREDIGVTVCDNVYADTQLLLRDSIHAAGAGRRERIAVVPGGWNESVEQLVEHAAKLNSERMVLVAPGAVNVNGYDLSGAWLAAAVAGVIAGQSDPAVPLGGAVLSGVTGVNRTYTDGELDLLIAGGVTPVEQLGGEVSVVRGVTTRTTTDGESDPTWRELTTVLIIDTVIPALRAALRSKFRRAKNTPRGRGAIRAQVVLELENFLAREIINGYDGVSVTADPTDPTRALVDFSFTVAHGLNQIWLSAHITV